MQPHVLMGCNRNACHSPKAPAVGVTDFAIIKMQSVHPTPSIVNNLDTSPLFLNGSALQVIKPNIKSKLIINLQLAFDCSVCRPTRTG